MGQEAALAPISDVRVTNVPLPVKGDVNVVNTPTVKLADGTHVVVSNVPPISPLTVGKVYEDQGNPQAGPFTVLETRAGNWVKVSQGNIEFLMNLNLIGTLKELS